MGKQSYLHTRKESPKAKDPCPICKNELYYDNRKTQRVGLLNEFEELHGWMCPHCKSRFTPEDKPTELYGSMKVEGEA
jgi:uncharacterized protein YlaI